MLCDTAVVEELLRSLSLPFGEMNELLGGLGEDPLSSPDCVLREFQTPLTRDLRPTHCGIREDGCFQIGGTFGGTAFWAWPLGSSLGSISYSESGADGRIRTGDPLFTKQLLCQLSYVGVRPDYMRAMRWRPSCAPARAR